MSDTQRLASGNSPRTEKIRIDRLTKRYGEDPTATVALEDFSMSIDDGEFVCIVGPSGCGKTTALRIIADLETPNTGEIAIQKHNGADRPLNSMVFQEQSLFPWMTVFENVAYGLEMRGVPRKERTERVAPFLEQVGLTRFSRHYPHQLSGGMRQRASLARAFVNDPEILLMDEPFAALDAQNKLLMQELLLRIWEGNRKTVIFITHGIDEAIVLSDRIAVMSASPGRIKEIIPVPFPRPRPVADLHGDPAFAALHLKIWRILESEVRISRQMQAQEQ
jgi:NitT/TauT family transport system ATP-binding protein